MRKLGVWTSALLALAWTALAALAAPAPSPTAPGTKPDARVLEFFEKKVRPVLAESCYKCHGPAKQLGGLRLDSRAAILQGGASGAAIVPGKPEQSLLIDAVNHKTRQMPPGGKLKAQEIAALAGWVRMGAPWPLERQKDEGGRMKGENPASGFRNPKSAVARAYWAFQPVREPAIPRVGEGWAKNPIDRFVFQKLKSAGLTPAAEAHKGTLIRRAYFDLTGLPPAPGEIDAFVADASPDAYEKLIDRLLASPRYGERYARHWLDLVRYADSDGYRIDDYRPHAWRYRDYVIKSFNEDKPYDRFVQEQLAGDELFPGDPEALIATGYLRHWIYEYNNRDVRGHWTTILNDITDTTGDVFLGLGVQCARCHDHKFDPILQKDYYRLQAFFAPLLPREDLTAAADDQVKQYQARLAAWEARTEDLRRQIEEIESRYRAGAAEEAIRKFPEDIQALIRKPVAQRDPLEHQLAELAYRQVYYEYDRLDRRFKPEDKEKVLALRKQLAAFDREKPEPLPVAFAVSDVGPKAPPVLIPRRGADPVAPGFPAVLQEGPAKIEPLPAAPHSTGRRAALARWLTRTDNPLTGRVIVNRVWQWHFGRGLAANASDFGTLGDKPTHPELLDWLACYFVGGNGEMRKWGNGFFISPFPHFPISSPRPWSLKNLHRLILTSATYKQSTRHPQAQAHALKDPENRMYWRGNVHRLDAEQIRDALLSVTGELDLRAGGPGVNSTEPRRTIYTRVMRNTRDPLLDVFDLPQFFTSASSRDTTTTPVQSLLLINSQGMLLRAKALAERLEREGGADEARMVSLAYRLAFGRAPGAEESAAARQFLQEQSRRIDPAEAGSAAAGFLHDKIPYRDGQAAVFSPGSPQRMFEVPPRERLPEGEFTIEAFFLARSVYDSGAVRTIAARWDGNTKSPGWALGVTGKQSRRKPQTVVLQLVGSKLDGSSGEEAIFSDQHIQLNKPYYVAASVQLATGGKPGAVTFYVKDLSNDDEPLLVAKVEHTITGGFANKLPLTIGGRSSKNDAFFDGLVDDVRLSDGALGVGQLLFTAEGVSRSTVGYWQFEAKPDVFRDASGNGLDIQPAARARRDVDTRKAALADFCHVLLNASEFLYVD
jgi:uncharacterized protein DUF1549/uncharacterized protein DUF1553/cytochrome c/concanavalin A-like lectin/glucanase superfamily protein